MQGLTAPVALLVAFATLSCILSVNGGSMEDRLREELFLQRNINPHVRPVMYFNKTLQVQLAVTILHIAGIDEKKQLLTTNNYVKMSWKDEAMKWDKDQYGGLESIKVPAEFVWKPDITLYNGAETVFPNSMVVVQSNGAVIWNPPAKLEAHCSMKDIKDYPFDEHECFLKFGSWTYDGYLVDVQIDNSTKTDQVKESGDWELISTKTVRTEKFYSCCEEPYPDVTYFITLRRRAPYYAISLVIPVVIMMLFTMATFWLPPYAEEKITIGCFNVIFLLAVISHLHWVVPRSHVFVPRIVIFTGCVLFLSGMSLILAVWTITLSRRQQFTSPPRWFEKIRWSKAGKVLCLPNTPVVEEENLLTSQNADIPDSPANAEDSQGRERQERGSPPSIPRKNRQDWIVFTTALDRFFFYCYCFSFIIVVTYSFC